MSEHTGWADESEEPARAPSLFSRNLGRSNVIKASAPRPTDRIGAMQTAVATLASESQRMLDELRQLAGEERHEVAELRAEVASLTARVQQLELLVERMTRHLVLDAAEHLPEVAEAPEPPTSLLPPRATRGLLRGLQGLRNQLEPEDARDFDGALTSLQSLNDRLEAERQFEERAGVLVELVRERLLAGRKRDELAQAQDHLLFVEIPDLLHRVEELALRSPGETRKELEGFRRLVLANAGLEEISPRSGEHYDPGRHNMLRAETDDGPSQTVGRCFSRGLSLQATGQLVRKADVSVYP